MATLTCSLNVTIPFSVVMTWSHNGSVISVITPNDVSTDKSIRTANATTAGNTTTLVIENPEPSNAGDYECAFNDGAGSGWLLRRRIRLLITSKLSKLANTHTDVCTNDDTAKMLAE